MINQSHPEAAERELLSLYPCDETIRQRLLKSLEEGMTLGDIARGSGVNRSIVSQYLSPAGNQYSGNVAIYEQKMNYFLERRDLEFLAGIETVETVITRQVETLVKAVRQQRIMGRGIGPAGIGKTRSALWAGMRDSTLKVFFVSAETGTREAVRSGMFRAFGIRGGQKTYGSSNLDKYRELVKRVRAADITFVFDQAHMLSTSAMHFLCELWNETRRGQLWLGTDALLDKLLRDEQIASRVEFGDVLAADIKTLEPIVQHQIRSLLPASSGEFSRLTHLCERLAANGSLRRVEMRLGTMLYLSEKPSNKGKSWCDLFEQAGEFSTVN